ncbi:alpha/beta fold hydrolase [bacterium]|nr:alpha/beta fold hydrolase [bacterium]
MMLTQIRLITYGLLVCLIASSDLAGTTSVWAQGTAKKPAIPAMQNMTLLTKDNVTLHATYFPSAAGRNAPVAVLLHGTKGNRLVWQAGVGTAPGFAQALQNNDFAVLTVDLRGHGENIAGGAAGKPEVVRFVPRDYQAMVAMDLEAVKKFLFDEHQKQALNMNKLAIVGADFSSAVALLYTELDWLKEPYDDAAIASQRTPRGQDVRALVLLSPDTRVPGLNVNNAVTMIRNMKMPVMIGVGKKDNQDKGSAKKLADLISPKTEEMPYLFLQQYDTKFRGAELLNKGVGVEPQMYKFLDEFVKKSTSEWRDRKSPLQD